MILVWSVIKDANVIKVLESFVLMNKENEFLIYVLWLKLLIVSVNRSIFRKIMICLIKEKVKQLKTFQILKIVY